MKKIKERLLAKKGKVKFQVTERRREADSSQLGKKEKSFSLKLSPFWAK